jgi:hypothetical protein
MIILYQYASRCRPARFWDGLFSILKHADDKDNFLVHAVLDEDDPTIDQLFIDNMAAMDRVYPGKFIWGFGQSTGKIHAINRPLPEVPWDILVNFSDDMRFIIDGFDTIIRDAVREHGPRCFLHFPDQDAGEALCTMTIEDRFYYNLDKYIYHPSYKSLWADNEAMEKAKLRDRYFFINTRIFDHLLPAMGHLPRDAQFNYQQSFWNEDKANYEKRKEMNFGLSCHQL